MKKRRLRKFRSSAESRARLNANALRSKYTRRELEYERGYQLFKIWSDERLKLNPSIGIFWVSKSNAHGYHKGDKILSKTQMQDFVAKGGKVREIHHFRDDYTNEAIKRLTYWMDIPMDGQHGFTKGQNVFTNLGEHLNDDTKGLLNIDLEDAFHQVKESDVFYILRVVFGLNKTTASEMAHFFCENGKLFQGNPVSPLIFNIYTARLAKSLKAIKWLKFSQYADDLTFSFSNEYVSYRTIKWLVRIIKDCGCKANPNKVVRQRVRPNSAGGEITGIRLWHTKPNSHHWRTCPRRNKHFKANYRLMQHLLSKGITQSKRKDKTGKPIQIEQIKEGLRNWMMQATAET